MKVNWIKSVSCLVLFVFFLSGCKDDATTENLASIDEYLAANNITAIEDPSGLKYEITKEGTGDSPSLTSKVTVVYKGMKTDGTVFDSSKGGTITYPLSNFIEGWKIGFQLLKKGSKAILYIPSNLAYGSRGAGAAIGPNTDLIFEVELVDFQ